MGGGVITPSQSRRTSRIVCSTISKRRAKSTPNSSNSAPRYPVPMPSSSRPLLMMSTTAASSASCAGFLKPGEENRGTQTDAIGSRGNRGRKSERLRQVTVVEEVVLGEPDRVDADALCFNRQIQRPRVEVGPRSAPLQRVPNVEVQAKPCQGTPVVSCPSRDYGHADGCARAQEELLEGRSPCRPADRSDENCTPI